MRFPSSRLILTALVALIFIATLLARRDYSLAGYAINDRFLSMVRDDRYNAILVDYKPQGESFGSVCVNDLSANNCLKIIVIDSRKSFPPGAEAVRDAIRLNAIALPGDVVIIDSYLLDFIFVASARVFALRFFGMQINMNGYTAEVLNWYQSLATLQREFSSHDLGGLADWEPIAAVADQYLEDNMFKKSDSLFDPAIAFAPIVEHEVSHLLLERGLANSIKRRVLAMLGLYDQLEEERRADRLGLVKSEGFLTVDVTSAMERSEAIRLKSFSKLPQGAFEGFFDLLYRDGFYSVSDYFVQLALFDFFDGFRGLSAKELFVKLRFKECSADAGKPATQFGDPSEVLQAEFSPVPLLTKSEFNGLVKRYDGAFPSGVSRAVHDSNLSRGLALSLQVKDHGVPRLWDYRDSASLANLASAVSARDYSLYDPSLAFSDTSVAVPDARDLKRALNYFGAEELDVCGDFECFVVFGKTGAFFNVVLRDNRLVRIDGYVNKYVGGDGERQQNLDIMATLILEAGVPKSEIRRAVETTRLSFSECAGSSEDFRVGKLLLTSTTLSDSGLVYFQIEPAN